MKKIFINAEIVYADSVKKKQWMLIENDRIVKTGMMEKGLKLPEAEQIIDVKGNIVMPGMIDIHSDMIEQLLQPRSTALMDFETSLQEAEKELTACGITTIYHSISMYRDGSWDVKEIRKAPQVKRLAKLIKKTEEKSRMMNHKYHLRYEIDNVSCLQEVFKLVKNGYANLLSFMDHTPLQGQYKDLSIYRKHLPEEGKDLTEEEFKKKIQEELQKEKVSLDKLKGLSDLAESLGISVASHDDDTVEKLKYNKQLGIKISEFPITMEVAKEAVELGYYTVLGAPNVLLGGSHSGNLSAIEAVKENCASVLCSDYYPQALLRAVFILVATLKMPLYEMCRLVTLNPAKAVGIDKDYGSLEAGKKADFLVLKKNKEMPNLEQTWVDGNCVMHMSRFNGGR